MVTWNYLKYIFTNSFFQSSVFQYQFYFRLSQIGVGLHLIGIFNYCSVPSQHILYNLFILFQGSGVFATRKLNCGNFVMEYPGKIISAEEGWALERGNGSLRLFYFRHGGKCLW